MLTLELLKKEYTIVTLQQKLGKEVGKTWLVKDLFCVKVYIVIVGKGLLIGGW